MRKLFWVGMLLVSGCALPRAAGAPLAPVERAKTEACSGRTADMSLVTFYAVDAPNGAIDLGGPVAHGWWVRTGNRIYLPANALGEEWLVRHEMLHALLQRGSHPSRAFVESCHLSSAQVWRDSTLTVDPENPRGR
jgi:hypothetical protein